MWAASRSVLNCCKSETDSGIAGRTLGATSKQRSKHTLDCGSLIPRHASKPAYSSQAAGAR
eukprot:152773-Prorocentrum_minimum.AAC.2